MARRGVEGFLIDAYPGRLEGRKGGIVRGRFLSVRPFIAGSSRPQLTHRWQGSGGEISSEFAMRTRLLMY